MTKQDHMRAFEAMQKAVDIVNTSPHPTHKISSALFNDEFIQCATNYWPQPILDKIGTDQRIGNSSSTIHAETAAILLSPKTQGSSICITDPFCPNCAKNIVEAGIETIYIDHKGFEKKFWEKSSGHFNNMSMEIVAKAGINVYEIHRKEKKIIPIFEAPLNYNPPEDSPIQIEPCPDSQGAFYTLVRDMVQQYHNRKFVTAMVEKPDGSTFSMTVRVHPVIGYTIQNDHDIEIITNPGQKYSYIQEPANRLLMNIKRQGYKLRPEYIFCSQVPTSRELVNMLGADVSKILIGEPFKVRHESDLDAKKILEKNGVIEFIPWV